MSCVKITVGVKNIRLEQSPESNPRHGDQHIFAGPVFRKVTRTADRVTFSYY